MFGLGWLKRRNLIRNQEAAEKKKLREQVLRLEQQADEYPSSCPPPTPEPARISPSSDMFDPLTMMLYMDLLTDDKTKCGGEEQQVTNAPTTVEQESVIGHGHEHRADDPTPATPAHEDSGCSHSSHDTSPSYDSGSSYDSGPSYDSDSGGSSGGDW